MESVSTVGHEVLTPRVLRDFRSGLVSDLSTWFAALDRPARLSFALTLLKLPITLVAFTLIVGHRVLPLAFLEAMAVVLVATAAVLDVFDGVVFKWSARAREKKLRDQRRVLDAVCDRVLIYGTVVPLGFIDFPVVAAALILVREFATAVVCGVPYLRRGFVCTPNLASRTATALIGVQVVYYCIGNEVSVVLSGVFIIVAIWGLAQYWVAPKTN